MSSETLPVCVECGRELRVGDWPFCSGNPDDHAPAKRFNMDPIEPYFDEDIVEGGVEITTRQQRRELMRRHNLDYNARRGVPGQRLYLDLGRR